MQPIDTSNLRVFLTGATGLLGREIAGQLLEAGFQVMALYRPQSPDRRQQTPGHDQIEWLEGEMGDLLVLQKAVQEADFVIHSAALVSFQPSDRKKLHQVNVEGTENLVNVCLLAPKLRKLVHISSVASLSPSKPMPTEIDERQGFNPDATTSDYAWSKYNAELHIIRGVEEGLKAVMVNPSIILAPGGKNESSAGLLAYARKGARFYPSGWLNFVDVRDVARVVVELLRRGPEQGERILLSAGHLPYRDFFSEMARRVGKNPPFLESKRWMTSLAWRAEALRAFLFSSRPLLTRFTAASSSKKLVYKGKALPEFWPGFGYRSLTETLDWILKGKE